MPPERRVNGARTGPASRKAAWKDVPPSYGIMPWVQVNGVWYFLAQAGYSSMKYDLKIDPMRGQHEGSELKWDTAVRECSEESGLFRTLSALFSLSTKAAQEQCKLSQLTIFHPSSSFAGLFKARIHEYASSLHYLWQGGPHMLWHTSRRSTLPWRTERRSVPCPDHSFKSCQL